MKMNWRIAMPPIAVIGLVGAFVITVLPRTSALAADQPATDQLADIVVTAQKREQNLQDVPISVTALSGKAVQEDQFVDAVDLAKYVPNMFLKDNLTGQMLTIRGVGSGVDNPGFEQAVAQFVDGVYYGRAVLDQNQMFDVERVEVVRGPQPTFAGQSATAGAISTYDRKPGDTLEGYVNGTYGKYKETSVETAIGGPVNDNVGVRLAGRYYELPETDYRNWNGAPVGTKRDSAERMTVTWKASDTLHFTFKAEHQDVFANGNGIGGGPSTCELNPRLSRSSAFLFPGMPALCALDVEALGLNLNNRGEAFTGGLLDARTALNQLNLQNGGTLANPVWGYNSNPATGVIGMQAIPYGLNHVTQFNAPQGEQYGFNVYNGNFTWLLGDLTLTSTTAFLNYDEFQQIDPTYSAFALFSDIRDEHFSQRSEEIRLTSPVNQTVYWMVGVYYDHHNLVSSDDVYLPWTTNAAFLPAGAQAISYGGQLSEVSDTYSEFAAATWNITNAFRANFGGRFQDVSKTGVLPASYAYLPAGNLEAGGTSFTAQQPYPGYPTAQGSMVERNFLPEVSLQYNVTDGVMTYAKWSEAVKAGGFVMEPVFAGGVPSPFSYRPEHANGYEAGVKATLFDHTLELNADWYFTRYKDLQISNYDHVTNAFATTNAGESHTRGVEFDGRWLVTHDFTFAFNGTVGARAVFDVFNGASCNSLEAKQEPAQCVTGVSRAGVDLPFSQAWTLNLNPDYVFAVSSGYEVKLDLFASFNASYTVENDNNPQNRQPEYERVDAHATIRPIGGNWEFGFYGRNLTDNRILLQDYTNFDSISLNPNVRDPWGGNYSLGIMYGVQFNARFGR